MQQSTQRVAWLITSMGYGDSLLYWEPILHEYIARFPNTRIFTSGAKKLSRPDIDVIDAVRINKFFVKPQKDTYHKTILFISPSIIIPLFKYKPELIILSEFGLLTVYGVLYRLLRPGTRILLLVESDPHQLAGNASRRLRRWIRRLICSAATHILTNNDAGQRYLTDEIGILGSRITTRPYLVSSIKTGVDSEHTCNIGHIAHTLDDYVAFLYVGQVTRRKGVFDLLDALLQIPADRRDRCRLWIVGSGDCYSEFQRAISERELGGQVTLFGSQPYDSLGDFYRSADVLVFPTRHDYRALVGFEALMFGLPMIHSRGDGAVREVVVEGENGFSFDPGDADAIARHMMYFIDNKNKIVSFGAQSRELASQFTVSESAEGLVNASFQALGVTG